MEDKIKLERYNKHISKLEELLKSVDIKGDYEQYRFAPCFMLFNFIDLLRSVALLDYNHMRFSGNIIIRSMFELLVDFLYCETNRNELYSRFGSYENVNRVLLYEAVPKEIKSKIDEETYRNYTFQEYKNFIKKYNINPDDKKDKKNY